MPPPYKGREIVKSFALLHWEFYREYPVVYHMSVAVRNVGCSHNCLLLRWFAEVFHSNPLLFAYIVAP